MSKLSSSFRHVLAPRLPEFVKSKHLSLGSLLARQLLLSMLLCSSIITLIITFFEIRDDYNQGISDIRSRQETIIASFSEPLSRNIWGIHSKQTDSLMRAIYAWDHIDHVEIHRDLGETLFIGTKPNSADLISAIGPILYYDDHRQEPVAVGELRLSSCLRPLYEQLINNVLVVLLQNSVKTLLTLAVAALLFRMFITRHLVHIASYFQSRKFSRSQEELCLNRRKGMSYDELDLIVNSINVANSEQLAMQTKIAEHSEQLEKELAAQNIALNEAHERLLSKEKLATIGSLVAMVAHELRNPLGAMRASAKLLSATASDQSSSLQIKAVDNIDRCITRCDKIIEDMRKFGGSHQVQLTKVNYGEWLGTALARLNLTSGTNIHRAFPADCYIKIDEFSHIQIIQNLIENALQSNNDNPAASDPPRIELKLIAVDGCAQLDISDNGKGFDESSIQDATTPLYTTKVYGFGMGLSIVQRLCKQHGGSLHLFNNINIGATARLRFPLVDETSTGT